MRAKQANVVGECLQDRILIVVIYVILVILLAVILYPLVYVLSASFSDSMAVYSGEMLLWPIRPTLDGYAYILNYTEIWMGYANTIFYTVVGTLMSLVFTLPCAYALSRSDLRGRGILMTFFMITMYFNGGLIPSYLTVKEYGLLDTRWVILLTGGFSVFNMIVARTFFATMISTEIIEAASIDGCDEFRTFMRIILPISKAIITVMILYYAVARWNSYFTEMVFLSTRAKFPLQLFLREILIQSQYSSQAVMGSSTMTPEQVAYLLKNAETANKVKYCIIVVSTIPMLVVYPFVQKYFEKGVMLGSVKG